MAFVPGFEHDVFVSYAHFDNEPDTQEIRWVSRFQADLKVALRQRLGVDPDLFFPERGASTREAKSVCRACPVQQECLEFALSNGEKFGIWGGMSERERRRVRRARALARAQQAKTA